MSSGPVVIGFDGTPAAERALRDAAGLLAPRPALVVVVWEPGRAFELLTLPGRALELPPVTVDVRAALAAERHAQEAAQRLAEQGAIVATDLGFQAEGLVVADDMSVADTLIRVAAEQDAQALVVGAHRHRGFAALLGSTAKALTESVSCPVVVVRAEEDRP